MKLRAQCCQVQQHSKTFSPVLIDACVCWVVQKLTDSGFRFLHGDIRSGLEAGTSSTHNEVY